jgi:hypothetical protein
MVPLEFYAYKKNANVDGEPIEMNMSFYDVESALRILREVIPDLEDRGWSTKVLRGTMLPWDIQES